MKLSIQTSKFPSPGVQFPALPLGIFGLGCLLLFLTLTYALVYERLGPVDRTLIDWVNQIHSAAATSILTGVTLLGSSVVVASGVLLAVLLLGLQRQFGPALMVPLTVVITYGLNEGLKSFVQRERPLHQLVEVTGYSFPSGHAMVGLAFYGLLAYLLCRHLRNGTLRYTLIIFFMLLVLVIGVSRIYLGVHYPSDVLAGFAAGGFCLVGAIFALQGLEKHFDQRKQTKYFRVPINFS